MTQNTENKTILANERLHQAIDAYSTSILDAMALYRNQNIDAIMLVDLLEAARNEFIRSRSAAISLLYPGNPRPE